MKYATSLVALALGSAVALQAMAQATPGATEVDFGPRGPTSLDGNSAVIDSTASPYDQALRAEVRAAITSDPALRGVDLAVSVSGGRVHISGSAFDENQARHAANVAMRIAGSARVSSAIATTR